MSDALRLRRAGGRGILFWASNFCICASALFWVWVFWNFTSPTVPTTAADWPLTIISVLLTVTLAGCMALVVPALWSAVLPSTAAGMLLQEAQRRTLGFIAAVIAAGYLVYLSYWVIVGYWGSRPLVIENGLATPMTIMTLIFFILVPALTWGWSSPEMWLAEVVQAHKVEKIRIAQTTEIIMMKTYYARDIALLKSGYDNLTTQQRTMIATDVRDLNLWLNEQWQQVAGLVAELTGVERNLLSRDDDGFMANTLTRIYDGLADDLTYVPPVPRVQPAELPPAPASAREITPPAAATGSPPREVTRELPREPETAISVESKSFAAYRVVWQAFGLNAWKRDQVEKVLNIKATKALALIREWIESGWVETLDNPKDHYQCVGGKA